jgi:membrane protein
MGQGIGWFSRAWWLFRRAWVSAYEDNCFGIAKGVAYSALLSFVPILTTTTALLVQANAESVSHVLSRLIFEVVPPGTEDIVMYSFATRGQRPLWLLVTAGVVSLWAASGAMTSLMEGFRAAYRIPKGRPFLRERGIAILLVIGAAAPVLGASILILLGGRVEQWTLTRLGLVRGGEQFWGWVGVMSRIGGYLTAFCSTTLVTALVYRFGPNHHERPMSVWPGAVAATAFWMAITSLFGWYVRNIANYNVLYGSVGATIALLVWMYLLAVTALVGCEVNAERERLRQALGR